MRQDITAGGPSGTSVAAPGPVAGSLDTSALTYLLTVRIFISGLGAGKRALFAIEDTASASPFSDANQVISAHFQGPLSGQGVEKSWQAYEIPVTRFGMVNSKLRLNCLNIDGSPGPVLVYASIE